MRKNLLCFFFFALWLPSLSAQTIRGVVYDKNAKEPVSNATVYLEGTSVHTISQEDGAFELLIKRQVQTRLIVSFLGYETAVVEHPFKEMPDTIFLKEKENLLGEVFVTKKKERYSREQCLAAFREQFLGFSRVAKACKILNEEDIVVLYDEKNRTLSAYCSQPIQILNSTLGYLIHYDLTSFQVEYNVNTLNAKNTKNFLLEGAPFFTDQGDNHPPILKKRRDAYLGSRNHFFRSLKDNRLKENRYALYQVKLLLELDELFSIEKPENENDLWKITLLSTTSKKVIDYLSQKIPVYLDVSVSHRNGDSQLEFLTTEFFVDHYGNYLPSKGIILLGTLAEKRIGDMLPLDYEAD